MADSIRDSKSQASANSHSYAAQISVLGDVRGRRAEVLTGEALAFLGELDSRFEGERQRLLRRREEVAEKLRAGAIPGRLAETEWIRSSEWQVPPPPFDLKDRRVEITGPTEAKMMINALNSGAKVFMADLEDSTSPTWENVIDGQVNLADAVERRLEFTSKDGKHYRLKDQLATLVVRPRGWHLPEAHLTVDGRPLSGSLVDFGLFFFHNARKLHARGSGPLFYLPKMESHLEARLWNEVFLFAQKCLDLPKGTIRATVLIETCLAAFEMEEILYELREHAAGLNAGRWDYLFSMIKKFAHRRDLVFPDRAELTMTVPFMRAYTRTLVEVCHKRGAHAIGGMAAFIPSRSNAEVNARAIAKVVEDKTREASDGFDGTWVVHPDLVPVAMDVFDQTLGSKPDQKHKRPNQVPNARELLPSVIQDGKITRSGVRNNISVALQYLNAWLMGTGAVAIFNLMEDAATAEIARAELWQWVRHKVKTVEGDVLEAVSFREICAQIAGELGGLSRGRMREAHDLLVRLVVDDRFEEFLTLPAYAILQKSGRREAGASHGSYGQGSSQQIQGRFMSAEQLANQWKTETRWKNIERPYTAKEVAALQPSVRVAHTLAERGSVRLWEMLQNKERHVATMGAMTGAQAVQMVSGGLKALYLSGWQVAADANLSGQTYPDQSLYPANSVPAVVKRINNALIRADQIERAEGGGKGTDWYAPIVADAEAGFGGPLHAFELTKAMIEAGASGVHFEDQLAAEKKCGHLGGKVLIPTSQFIRTLTAARLASDVLGVPTVIIARTDSLGANLLTSDIDDYDRSFLTGERTAEGYYRVKPGMAAAIARGQAYAPYADMLWVETSKPDLKEAKEFAEAIHKKFPGKLLAYNCSPSFNWSANLRPDVIAKFQAELNSMGYKFQFITLAGWHLLNLNSFELAHAYAAKGMPAYVDLQDREFARERDGYTATRHQREVGTGYFDRVLMTVSQGQASTGALSHSTEAEQFSPAGHSASHF